MFPKELSFVNSNVHRVQKLMVFGCIYKHDLNFGVPNFQSDIHRVFSLLSVCNCYFEKSEGKVVTIYGLGELKYIWRLHY